MRKKIIAIILTSFIILSACGNQEKSLIGTWKVEDGKEGESILMFSENGAIKEELGIFDDTYGVSWQLSDDKIQFIYYGEVEEQATYEINGNKLTLNLEKEDDTVILERQ